MILIEKLKDAAEELLHAGMSEQEINDHINDVLEDFRHFNIRRDDDGVIQS